MRLVLAVAFAFIAAPALATDDCGVYTDRDQKPGHVVAELRPDLLVLRVAPDFEYLVVLSPQKPGENFRWGLPETDAIGRMKVREDGRNLLLDMADAPVMEEVEASPSTPEPEIFTSAVYVPFCPPGA